jgi:hypothetical protein
VPALLIPLQTPIIMSADAVEEQAEDVDWPESAILMVNDSGIANLKLQNPVMKEFIERAIEFSLRYAAIHEAYPDFTRKSTFTAEALQEAAKGDRFRDIRSRVHCDKGFVRRIAHVVSLRLSLSLSSVNSSVRSRLVSPRLVLMQREKQLGMSLGIMR